MCRTRAWELRQQRGCEMCIPLPLSLVDCRVSLISHLIQYNIIVIKPDVGSCTTRASWLAGPWWGWLTVPICTYPGPQTSLNVTNRW